MRAAFFYAFIFLQAILLGRPPEACFRVLIVADTLDIRILL